MEKVVAVGIWLVIKHIPWDGDRRRNRTVTGILCSRDNYIVTKMESLIKTALSKCHYFAQELWLDLIVQGL